MTVGKSDPNYAATLTRCAKPSGTAAALTGELAQLQERLAQTLMKPTKSRLWIQSTLSRCGNWPPPPNASPTGSTKSKPGARSSPPARPSWTSEAAKELSQLGPFQEGAEQLVAGLARLTGGTTELERRLGEVYSRSYPVESGAKRIAVRVQSQSEPIQNRVKRLNGPRRASSTRVTSSSRPSTAPAASCTNAPPKRSTSNSGGQAATLPVIPKDRSTRPARSRSTRSSMKTPARSAGRPASKTGVAGGPATLNTYSHVTKERIPIVIAAIILATFLVLVLVLRSLPLAAIAVGLNMATVGVAFGVLMLLTNVPEGWPLGGRPTSTRSAR